MLTNHQMEEYRRYKTLSEFFAVPANITIFSVYPPFVSEINTYNNNFTTLDGLVPHKDVIATGITTQKETVKRDTANALAIIMDKTRAFAITYAFPELAAQMFTNASEIFRIDDEDFQAYVIGVVANINTNAVPNAAYAQYNVTGGDLVAVLTTAATFHSLIGQAKNLSSTSTVANTDIDATIKLLHNSLDVFDLLISNFAVSNPDFVEGYHINSAVDNLPIRHSGIDGVVTTGATPAPLSGVTITLVGTTKSAVTDLLGHYSLTRVKTANYQVQLSKAGYQMATQIVHIRRGRIDTVNFQLTPNP